MPLQLFYLDATIVSDESRLLDERDSGSNAFLEGNGSCEEGKAEEQHE